MPLTQRFRIPALFCALAVLLCELVSRPYADMGVCDDGSYILIAQKLALTGHIVYNGWVAAMLGWQLYVGAAFIKLFGYSMTHVRLSTWLVAMASAFMLQRTLVRAALSERNATIGTLALALSPLFLALSATFMSDMFGLFSIVLCLYGCLRALAGPSPRSMIRWLCFAVFANVVFGSARQISWLGALVMVPSALFLLRANRRVLLAGAAATLAGVVIIVGCMHWFMQQPYIQPTDRFIGAIPLGFLSGQVIHALFDLPFLLLPVIALFFPALRRNRPAFLATLAALAVAYLFLAVYPSHLRGNFLLEPALGDWVDVHGRYGFVALQGEQPILLHRSVQALLTFVSIGGLLGLASLWLQRLSVSPATQSSSSISTLTWKQLGVLLVPFTLAYVLLILLRLGSLVFLDRYLLAVLVVLLLFLVRFYQERVGLELPRASLLLVGISAIYGIVVTHNTFALARARVALAAELRSAGVPDTAVDNGWEYNFPLQIQRSGYVNDYRIVKPAHAYVPAAAPPMGICQAVWWDKIPDIRPVYGISFDPHTCNGPTPFAPVHYSQWLASTGTLYVVRYTAPPQP